jgi:hypothetical protein
MVRIELELLGKSIKDRIEVSSPDAEMELRPASYCPRRSEPTAKPELPGITLSYGMVRFISLF